MHFIYSINRLNNRLDRIDSIKSDPYGLLIMVTVFSVLMSLRPAKQITGFLFLCSILATLKINHVKNTFYFKDLKNREHLIKTTPIMN